MSKLSIIAIGSIIIFATSYKSKDEDKKKQENAGKQDTIATSAHQTVNLPAPYATKSSTKVSNVVGWPQCKTPVAPEAFTVTKFADNLDNPRWIYEGPNGDIFISEASTEKNVVKQVKTIVSSRAKAGNISGSADRIILLRDANHDGIPEVKTTFLENLNQPFGMLNLRQYFLCCKY